MNVSGELERRPSRDGQAAGRRGCGGSPAKRQGSGRHGARGCTAPGRTMSRKNKENGWRPRPESNRGARICSPLRNHSATRPSGPVRNRRSGGPDPIRCAVSPASGGRPGDEGSLAGPGPAPQQGPAAKPRPAATKWSRLAKIRSDPENPLRALPGLGSAPAAIPDSSVGRAGDC